MNACIQVIKKGINQQLLISMKLIIFLLKLHYFPSGMKDMYDEQFIRHLNTCISIKSHVTVSNTCIVILLFF